MNDDVIYQDFEYANSFKLGELTGQKIIQSVYDGNIDEIKRLLSLPVEKGGLVLLRYLRRINMGKPLKKLPCKLIIKK